MNTRTHSQSAIFLLALGFTAHAQITTFTAGTQASAAAVNANFKHLDTSLTNSVARLTAQIAALEAKAKVDSTTLANKASSDLAAVITKAKSDSIAMITKIRLDSVAMGTQSIPKGTVAGFLTAPGNDNYLPGSNSTWYIANGAGLVNAVNVPDLRGQFLRGMNVGRTDSLADPISGRTVGSQQGDVLQGHRHLEYVDAGWGVPVQLVSGGEPVGPVVTGGGGGVYFLNSSRAQLDNAKQITTSPPYQDGTNGTPRIASETRPKNVAVYWYVKVK